MRTTLFLFKKPIRNAMLWFGGTLSDTDENGGSLNALQANQHLFADTSRVESHRDHVSIFHIELSAGISAL